MAATSNGIHSDDVDRDALPTPPSPSGSTSSLPSDFGSITSADGRGDFRAPLSDSFSDVSIDGTSVGAELDADADDRPDRPEDVTAEAREEALRIKSKANDRFKASDWQEALDLYTLSLSKNPFDPAVLCNRAAVRLKREEHGLAIADASKALTFDPRYVKAFYRRAVAQLSIMQPEAALADLKRVVALDPKNATAKAQLESTVKLIRRKAFEKAIASDDEPLASTKCRQQLDDGAAEVEASYTGPRLQETRVDGKLVAKPSREFIEGLIEHFRSGKLIPRRFVWLIALGCQEVLLSHQSLVDIEIKAGQTLDVMGDTHGQYFDLMHLLNQTGLPSDDHLMLFNGDFVDRGSWSTEVVIVLFALKWLYPDRVFLSRGNHETSDMNKVYGFEGETKKKYSEMTFRLFEEIFCALPIGHLITASQPPQKRKDPRLPLKPTLGPNGTIRYLVLHGGLFSRDDVGLEDIRKIDRLRQKQPSGDTIMGEALWCDPQMANGRGPSKRGIGLGFGPDITKRFCQANQIAGLIRSHEVRPEGYSIDHDGLCMTVFSAPNYCDQVGNAGAWGHLDDAGTLTFETFQAQPHPDIKPMAYAGSFGMSGMI